jgi:hypothetical protein
VAPSRYRRLLRRATQRAYAHQFAFQSGVRQTHPG